MRFVHRVWHQIIPTVRCYESLGIFPCRTTLFYFCLTKDCKIVKVQRTEHKNAVYTLKPPLRDLQIGVRSAETMTMSSAESKCLRLPAASCCDNSVSCFGRCKWPKTTFARSMFQAEKERAYISLRHLELPCDNSSIMPTEKDELRQKSAALPLLTSWLLRQQLPDPLPTASFDFLAAEIHQDKEKQLQNLDPPFIHAWRSIPWSDFVTSRNEIYKFSANAKAEGSIKMWRHLPHFPIIFRDF